MKHDIDRLLKHALSPDIQPDPRLNQNILNQAEEMTFMSRGKRNRFPAAAVIAACCILVLGSTTAFAAWKLLSPAQVAEEHMDTKLAEAFQGKDAILVDETQEFGSYRVTLMGAVAGKNLSKYLVTENDGSVRDDRFYGVVAIARTDGTPMPDTSSDEYGDARFFVSPYIKGLNPGRYSIATMDGGYSEFIRDGVQYRLIEMDNIEIFADRGIYIGVNSGDFYDSNAYLVDEKTGEMTRNEAYNGVNALFVLPMDASKADPAAAQAYLDELEKPAEPETMEKDETDLTVEEWVDRLNGENLEKYCQLIEGTKQICKPGKDGWCDYSYEVSDENGTVSGGSAFVLDELFPEGTKPGTAKCVGFSYSDRGLSDLIIDMVILNEDHTATVGAYKPRAEMIETENKQGTESQEAAEFGAVVRQMEIKE